MKILLALLFTLSSFAALANVDLLVGSYKGTSGDTEAKVSKVLVSQATLFEPAKYAYKILLKNFDLGFEVDKTLTIAGDAKSLYTNVELECDDPGCVYFSDIAINVSKKAAKATIEVEYEASQYDEEGFGSKDVSGKFKLVKIK